MESPITLERFRPKVSPIAPPAKAKADRPMLESLLRPIEEAPTEPEPDPVDAEEPTVEAAPDPVHPEPEPAIREAVLLSAVSERLDHFLADQERWRHSANCRAAAAFGQAASRIFPTLASSLFTAELAQASLRLADATKGGQMYLHISPEHVDALVDCLAAHSKKLTLEIVPDAEIDPGKAELHWAEGGAEFDTEKLVSQALDFLEARLSTSSEKGSTDE